MQILISTQLLWYEGLWIDSSYVLVVIGEEVIDGSLCDFAENNVSVKEKRIILNGTITQKGTKYDK